MFSVDGKLYRFFSRLWDMTVLNFIWLVTSFVIVPVIMYFLYNFGLVSFKAFITTFFPVLLFFGPATVAAFCITNKMIDDSEGYILRSFLNAYKENLKQGVPLGLITLVAGYAVFLDFQLFNAYEDNPIIFLIAGFVGCFVFTLSLIYAYALIARYDNTLFASLKNSFRISLKYFLRTLILIAVLGVEIIVFLWNNVTLWIGVFIGPACLFLTVSGFAMYFFRNIERENENSGN